MQRRMSLREDAAAHEESVTTRTGMRPGGLNRIVGIIRTVRCALIPPALIQIACQPRRGRPRVASRSAAKSASTGRSARRSCKRSPRWPRAEAAGHAA
jgi:hypothetical protein